MHKLICFGGTEIVKVWPLLVRCMDMGAGLCLIMESMESRSVVNALLRLQLWMDRIDRVSMDSSTNLIELKRISEVSNGLLKFKQVVVQAVDSQFRNYCEWAVQIIKKSCEDDDMYIKAPDIACS